MLPHAFSHPQSICQVYSTAWKLEKDKGKKRACAAAARRKLLASNLFFPLRREIISKHDSVAPQMTVSELVNKVMIVLLKGHHLFQFMRWASTYGPNESLAVQRVLRDVV